MSAAQLDLQPELIPASTDSGGSALKDQVAERLAAHRARRSALSKPALPPPQPQAARGRSAEIAAAVKQRYEQSPSYRSVLAAEAERATRHAEAVAEVASINARAIARAQQQLLAELGDWHEPQPPLSSIPISAALPAAQPAAAAAAILLQQHSAQQQTAAARVVLRPESAAPAGSPAGALIPPSHEVASAGYTVRLYEDAGRGTPSPLAYTAPFRPSFEPDEDEAQMLEDEIAFRLDPAFAETAAPEPLPANLIEFPRQLVAARRARPRLAEGPLRDDAPDEPAQLRIFEVEAQHISVAPDAEAEAPEWTSILLSAQPEPTFFQSPLDADYSPALVPQAAPLGRRLLAGTIDLAIIAATVTAGVALFIETVFHLTAVPLTLPLPLTLGAIVAALFVFASIFHLLFFTYAEATPGMRYARVALCTLSDENPTRSAMRHRYLAMLLSAAPLGLGYLWAFVDEDGFGWHDRISRMYQRSY